MTLIALTSPGEVLLSLVTIITVVVASSAIYNALFHPLRAFPGPWAYGISRLPYTYHWLRGDLVMHVAALHRKYGTIVRVAPNELSFSDPQAWNDIMGGGSKDLKKWGGFYGVPKFMPPHIQNTTDKAHHRMLRKATGPGFSDAALRAQENVVASHIDQFIQQLREKSDGRAATNLDDWYRFIVFDVIGDLALGESFGCVKGSDFHPWIRAISESGVMMSVLTALNMYPVVSDVVNFLVGKLANSGFAAQKRTLRPILERRVQSETQRLDLVHPLIMKMDEWNMTVDDMIPHAIVFVGAGSETTAGVLCAATAYLIENHDAMARVKMEVRSAFSSEAEINLEKVDTKLPFLRACIEEALRLYPQTGSASLRVTGNNDIICGTPIPPKTIVGIWTYGMYRDPKLWRNPNEFRPERWVGDPEYADDVREAFIPFFMGSRDCIGKGLATMELRLIFTRMIYNFDMEIQDESRNWADKQRNLVIVWEKGPLNVVLTPTKN